MKLRLMSATAMGLLAASRFVGMAEAQGVTGDDCRDGVDEMGVPQDGTLECGDGAVASARDATALGDSATAAGGDSTAAGRDAEVLSEGSTALGADSEIAEGADYSVAIGYDSDVADNTDNAIAIGRTAHVEGRSVTSDEDIDEVGNASIAIGRNAFVIGNESISVGREALTSGNSSAAFGNGARVGQFNFASRDIPINGGLALGGDFDNDGIGADVQHENSVALGADSATTAERSVSVGNASEGLTRRIMNVTDGIEDSDAATVGQVGALIEASSKCRDGMDAMGVVQDGSLECGDGAVASAQDATALGDGAEATQRYATAVGHYATADAEGSTALGEDAYVGEGAERGVAVGNEAYIDDDTDDGIAIGQNAYVEGRLVTTDEDDDGIGNSSIAIGREASVFGNESTALGPGAKTSGNHSAAFGDGARVGVSAFGVPDTPIHGGLALGGDLNGDGIGADVQHRNSVALGADSVTAAVDSVSVGYAADPLTGDFLTRRIMNVSDGELDSDAATVGQVGALIEASSKCRDGMDAMGVVQDGSLECGDGADARAIGATALGDSSRASAIASTAVGESAAADGEYSLALGQGSFVAAGADESIAIGSRAAVAVNTDSAIALGNGATVQGSAVTMLEDDDEVGNESIAIGFETRVFGNESMAVGPNARISGNNSAAFGDGARVGIAANFGVFAPVNGGLALGGDMDGDGVGARAEHDNSVALGADSVTAAVDSVSVGYAADPLTPDDFLTRRIMNVKDGELDTDAATVGQLDDAIAAATELIDINDGGGTLNFSTTATGNFGLAIGGNANASTTGSVAIGSFAGAGTENFATAIGYSAMASGENSVALGAGSLATEAYTVSVGIAADPNDPDDFLRRRITNVLDGTNESDAATVGQLNAAIAGVGGGAATPYLDVNSDGTLPSALGTDSIALGEDARANAISAIAIGDGANTGEPEEGSTSGSTHSIAIGTSAETDATNAIAIGRSSFADGEASIALGRVARAEASDSVSIGGNAISFGDKSIAIGRLAATGTDTIDAENAIAIGAAAEALAINSVAIGSGGTDTFQETTRATHENSIALGAASKTSDEFTLSIGDVDNNLTRRITSVEDGINESDAATVGQLNAAIAGVGGGGTATPYLDVNSMGTLPSAEGLDSIALGARAETSVDAEDGVAIGSDAKVTALNAVALGSDSVADEDDTVSVGSATKKRKVTNLADGAVSSDAATYGQLTTLGQTVTNNTGAIASNLALIQANTSTLTTLGGTVSDQGDAINTLTGRVDTLTSRVDTLDTLGDTVSDQADTINNLEDRVDTLETSNAGSGGTPLVTDGSGDNSLQGGENADASGDNSTAFGPNARATTDSSTAVGVDSRAEGSTAVGGRAEALGDDSAAFGIEAQAHGDQSTAIGEFTTASATGASAFGTNASATAENSVALGAASVAARANAVSVGSAGAERQITNVARGTAMTDAVNVGQLNDEIATVNTAIDVNAQAISTNSAAISTNSTAISDNVSAISTNSAAISDNNSAISNNSAAINTNLTSINSNQSAIAVNAADIALLDAGIEGDGERFIALEETAANNTTAITTLNGQVSANQTRIARNASGVAANTASINTLNAQFENLDYRVDALTNHIRKVNHEIDENTAGIAIANALAGSTWLQANERMAISGNVGYFDGNSAIAFSGAARLNERFSANIAIGTVPANGDVGGRAGVRFGW